MQPNEISEAQLAANRANAQKSTGPRTESGKASARFNARRHGLTGQFYCMSEEDEKAYKDFETNMFQDLRPAGAYEKQLAISITQDHWRLNRSRSVEFNLYGKGHDRFAEDTDAPTANMQAASTMADTYQSDNRVFANIALYETRIHRMIAKNRKELNELRAVREAREAVIRKEARMLVQLADLTGAALTDVGLIPTNDGLGFVYPCDDLSAGHIPADSLPGSESLVHGFVFSLAATRAIIQRDRLLRLATECEKKAWDRSRISLSALTEDLLAA